MVETMEDGEEGYDRNAADERETRTCQHQPCEDHDRGEDHDLDGGHDERTRRGARRHHTDEDAGDHPAVVPTLLRGPETDGDHDYEVVPAVQGMIEAFRPTAEGCCVAGMGQC